MSKKHQPNNKQAATTQTAQDSAEKIQPPQKRSWKKMLFSEQTLIVVLLLVIISLSTFFRMYPAHLPATEQWAEDSIANQIKQSVEQQVAKEFPNLPTAQRNEHVAEQVAQIMQAQAASIAPQQEQLAAQFTSQLQDEHNNTYLLAIDPYIWHSYAKNYVANGSFGDEVVDGKASFSLRAGQEPYFTKFYLHPYLTVQFYKLTHFFDEGFTLQRAAFLMPVIIIAFAIIAAFFLGRKIGGNVSGFVAGLIVALNGALLGRTPAGFSDTDAYLIFFPLLISWLYLEALTSKHWRRRGMMLALTGLASVLFWQTWNRWWHIASILMAMTAIYFIYTMYQERKVLLKEKKNISFLVGKTRSGRIVLSVLGFFAFLLIFSSLFSAVIGTEQRFFSPVTDIIVQPLSVLSVKSVATADIWPNVLTTVAELNEGSWKQILNSVGGKLFFFIGGLGVLLTFFLRTEDDTFEIRYASFLALWFFGLSLVGIMSARFIALLAAPFAIAFGAFFGIAWRKGSALFEKEANVPALVTKLSIAIIILLLFIAPIKSAHAISSNEIPSMDDTWHASLEEIKQDSDDGIITSWWDFGHWFINIAERRVTFDGGDQGRRIYWVGKSLMTPDEAENKAILRMLNCGQNKGYELLLEELNDSYEASELINTIYVQEKETAQATLAEANLASTTIDAVLAKTHCENDELLPQYYIVSEDMVGKSSVWAHFGGWDFDKAYSYYLSKKFNYETAAEKMQEQMGLSEDEANKWYYEATSLETNREVDGWISPWPSYITSSSRACQEQNNTLVCNMNQNIGRQQGQNVFIDKAIIPLDKPEETLLSVVIEQNGAVQKVDPITPKAVNLPGDDAFITTSINDANFPYELTVGLTETGIYRAIIAESALAQSSFTKLFYFDGMYMDDYEKLSDRTTFRGQRIIVYKVDVTT